MRVQLKFSGTDQDPGIEALQPKNFFANELMVFILSTLNGCYCGEDSIGTSSV
jgi:hypothetical protein